MPLFKRKLYPKKDYIGISDIIKEVSKETKFSKKDLDELFRVHKLYVKHLMKKEEVQRIKLSPLGELYWSYDRTKNLSWANSRNAKMREGFKKYDESTTSSQIVNRLMWGVKKMYRALKRQEGWRRRDGVRIKYPSKTGMRIALEKYAKKVNFD